MPKLITIYPYTIMEDGIVTAPGTPDTGYPLSRLYDRAQGTFYKKTGGDSSSSFIFYAKVDQGVVSPKYVDTLIIPKHNFLGEDLQWQYSSDNFVGDINDAVTDWNQADNTQIVKEMTAENDARYWRLISSSLDEIRCSEVYMSYGYDFNIKIDPLPAIGEVANITEEQSVGGMSRITKFGDIIRTRKYSLKLDSDDLDDWHEVTSYLDNYSKYFYIKDHLDEVWLASFASIPQEIFYGTTTPNLTTLTINLIEKL